jgi:small neutral amino acid transporter SnatA (MarC family)
MRKPFLPPRQEVGLSFRQILFEFSLMVIPIFIFGSVSNFFNTRTDGETWGPGFRLLGPLGALATYVLYSWHLNKYEETQRKAINDYNVLFLFIVILVSIIGGFIWFKVWGGR